MKDEVATKALAPDSSAVATCHLHDELIRRRDVVAQFVAPDEAYAMEFRGACWVIVNRD